MQPKISAADFAVLAAQTGLPLTAEQLRELHQGYATIEAMLARINRTRPRADEPAHVFRAGAFGPRP